LDGFCWSWPDLFVHYLHNAGCKREMEGCVSDDALPIDEAARAIVEADILIFALGAGASADSNLAVFVDIANYKVYEDQKLSYTDLSTSTWLKNGKEDVFFGFWGTSFNNYRAARPHEGYDILRKWKHDVEGRGAEVLSRMQKIYSAATSPCFVYTSK
jgi:hypothetical protein